MAKLECGQQKKRIMVKKKELKRKIYINDGLTKEEREVQRILREY